MPANAGVAAIALASQAPVLIPDGAAADARVANPAIRAGGFRSLMVAPLIVGGTAIGVLEVARRVRQLDPRVDRLLRIVADRIAVTMEHARLQAEARELADVVRRIGEGVVVTDVDDAVIFANRAFAEMVGVPGEALRGRRWTELLATSQDVAALTAQMRQASWQGEVLLITRSGDARPVLVTLSTATHRRGRGGAHRRLPRRQPRARAALPAHPRAEVPHARLAGGGRRPQHQQPADARARLDRDAAGAPGRRRGDRPRRARPRAARDQPGRLRQRGDGAPAAGVLAAGARARSRGRAATRRARAAAGADAPAVGQRGGPPGHPLRDRPEGRAGAAHPGRGQRDPRGAAQHPRECPGRDALRRPAHAARARRGGPGGGVDRRHRARHEPGGPAAGLRAVLHHAIERGRLGAGPEPGPGDRSPLSGLDRGVEPRGRGHDLHAVVPRDHRRGRARAGLPAERWSRCASSPSRTSRRCSTSSARC